MHYQTGQSIPEETRLAWQGSRSYQGCAVSTAPAGSPAFLGPWELSLPLWGGGSASCCPSFPGTHACNCRQPMCKAPLGQPSVNVTLLIFKDTRLASTHHLLYIRALSYHRL